MTDAWTQPSYYRSLWGDPVFFFVLPAFPAIMYLSFVMIKQLNAATRFYRSVPLRKLTCVVDSIKAISKTTTPKTNV